MMNSSRQNTVPVSSVLLFFPPFFTFFRNWGFSAHGGILHRVQDRVALSHAGLCRSHRPTLSRALPSNDTKRGTYQLNAGYQHNGEGTDRD
jgi:hypothetical protein